MLVLLHYLDGIDKKKRRSYFNISRLAFFE